MPPLLNVNTTDIGAAVRLWLQGERAIAMDNFGTELNFFEPYA